MRKGGLTGPAQVCVLQAQVFEAGEGLDRFVCLAPPPPTPTCGTEAATIPPSQVPHSQPLFVNSTPMTDVTAAQLSVCTLKEGWWKAARTILNVKSHVKRCVLNVSAPNLPSWTSALCRFPVLQVKTFKALLCFPLRKCQGYAWLGLNKVEVMQE